MRRSHDKRLIFSEKGDFLCQVEMEQVPWEWGR
jgi:hypothetical protein